MGKREQAGKSHSCPSHSRPCFTGRKEEGGRKKLKQIFQQKRKQHFLISGRKYRATQIQVIKFFIDNNLPNFVLN